MNGVSNAASTIQSSSKTLLIDTAVIPTNAELITGVIRNTGSGWDLLTGGGHCPFGVDSVTDNSNTIVIHFSSLNATDVISFLVVPDEEFAGLYDVGASFGLTQAALKVYKRQYDNDLEALITHQGSGVFVSNNANITPSYAAGTGILTLTHTSTTNNVPTVYSLQTNDADRTVFWNSTNSLGAAVTRFKLYDADGVTQKNLANPDMTRFYFDRSEGNITQVQQDPTTIISASGNFWFIGFVKK